MSKPLPLFTRAFVDSWRATLGWAAGLAAAIFIYLPLYPSIGASPEMQGLMDSFPPEMIKALPGGGHMLPTPQRDFRLGVLLIACGVAIAAIGLCVFIAVTSEGGPAVAIGVSIAAAGAIPGCIGAALVILSRDDKRVVEP